MGWQEGRGVPETALHAVTIFLWMPEQRLLKNLYDPGPRARRVEVLPVKRPCRCILFHLPSLLKDCGRLWRLLLKRTKARPGRESPNSPRGQQEALLPAAKSCLKHDPAKILCMGSSNILCMGSKILRMVSPKKPRKNRNLIFLYSRMTLKSTP